MKAHKYPFYYFLILFVLLILSVLFWISIWGNSQRFTGPRLANNVSDQVYWTRDYLPENVGRIKPIDTSKIINDSLSNRRIVSNLVNIAIKNSSNSIARFASDLKSGYPSSHYEIVYLDSIVNRLQVELPAENRIKFKEEIRQKLPEYDLLIWDETLFDHVRIYSDPMLADSKANWYLDAIKIEDAWQKTTGNKDIVIAVIDNGFDLTHPELQNKAVRPYNVIDQSANVQPNSVNHGTHVASTIVGNGDNNEGLVGICPDCSFMPIKVEDQNGIMTNTYIIDAILYAIRNGADVINLSLGMQLPNFIQIPLHDQEVYVASGAKDEEEFWNDLFHFAQEQNVTCVLAAGNNNMLTGFDSFRRTPSTIKVGAFDSNFAKAIFSNFGDHTTIYAPGVNIFGASSNSGYEFLQGTSMAAPIVAGFIGLIKSTTPGITNAEVLERLNSNMMDLNGIKMLSTVQLN